MTRNSLIAASMAGLLMVGCAPIQDLFAPPRTYAQTPPSTHWTPPPKGYLGATPGLDGALIVGPAPEPKSVRGRADRKIYNQTRKLAGTPAWDKAIADADLSGAEGFKSFSCAAGVKIGPQDTPVLARLLLRMTGDAATIYQPAKAVFQRARPPVGNKKPICVPREKWIETDGSYPSGHGLIGWSWGLVISEAAPDRASAILARGALSGRRHGFQAAPERGVHERSGNGKGRGGGVTGQGGADGVWRLDCFPPPCGEGGPEGVGWGSGAVRWMGFAC